ncbi:MAG: transcription termination factor NusA [Lentisphaeria bacterium]|nr:transcription termination factor NusA [Lentisphaeria bacterium]MBR2911914.1 transcription termination factor NusA [Lentisphaeria bacterium]
MANELLTILEYIEQERGISRNSLVKALETAILTASRKSIHPASDLRVVIDPRTGSIQAWARLTVVEENPNNDQISLERAQERFPGVVVGEVVDWEVTPRNFGRIAAQTARQAIVQQIRRAEKENVLEEFADRVGQIINGTVRRFEGGNVIIDFQKAEGIMYAKEKVHDEQYMPGDRINVLLQKVDINAAGPSLIVSRASAEFVSKLFEREVSEMHDGIVRIVACVREPGRRTKIAVASSDPRVDPVGACVGVRGTRVRRVTDEFDSEKIDIIPYDEDIRKYAANALAPAKVQNVEVNEEKHELTVTVAGEQQSKLAFGRRAQNVRLSAKLIGWKISLKSSDASAGNGPSISQQLAAAAGKLAEELGVSDKTAQKLVDNGFVTLDGVLAAEPATLAAIDGIDADEITAARERLANE